MSEKGSFIGKSFDFCASERDGISQRAQRAADLEAEGRAMMQQAIEERRHAVQRAIAFALERVGAPATSAVESRVKDGEPIGFTIVERKKLAGAKPPKKPAKI